LVKRDPWAQPISLKGFGEQRFIHAGQGRPRSKVQLQFAIWASEAIVWGEARHGTSFLSEKIVRTGRRVAKEESSEKNRGNNLSRNMSPGPFARGEEESKTFNKCGDKKERKHNNKGGIRKERRSQQGSCLARKEKIEKTAKRNIKTVDKFVLNGETYILPDGQKRKGESANRIRRSWPRTQCPNVAKGL